MSDEVRAIEEFFARRYGPQALYLPSGRLALYLALREWLRLGDRVLMSPVNDDVVFFTVLAAGLVPVPVRWIRARLPAGPRAARWSRDVLPVDPLRADRFLTLLGESPGLCEPSSEARQ